MCILHVTTMKIKILKGQNHVKLNKPEKETQAKQDLTYPWNLKISDLLEVECRILIPDARYKGKTFKNEKWTVK